MARRRNSAIASLMDLPWQASVVVAMVAFIAMRWILPMQARDSVLFPLANTISGFAPLAGIVFLVIGGISLARNRTRADRGFVKNSSAQSNPTFEHTITVPPNITEWSFDLLRSMEWKRFEMLCAEYFRVLGKRVETVAQGADGGIDGRIYKNDSGVLEFAIQCKAWNSVVGIKHVRELFDVMAHESAGKGIFMTTSSFSDDARRFAAQHKDTLFLVDGEKFLSMISSLPEEKQRRLLHFATEGDYATPTCASCGVKMIHRTGKDGPYWGCSNYPKCKSTLRIATV